jgi:polyisoprenoid-binding protein YceI
METLWRLLIMTSNHKFRAPLFAAAVFLSTNLLAGSWDIDSAHSEAKFKIKHMTVSNVTGSLTGMKGAFEYDDKNPSALKVEASLDTKTINTNNEKRDGHLKNPDFFDVAKYPTIKFKSTRVDGNPTSKFKLLGDLTMHGVTKPVWFESDGITAPIKDMYGNNRRGFSATAKINRKDFGIVWNRTMEAGGLVLGETVDVALEVELTSAPTATASAPAKPKG